MCRLPTVAGLFFFGVEVLLAGLAERLADGFLCLVGVDMVNVYNFLFYTLHQRSQLQKFPYRRKILIQKTIVTKICLSITMYLSQSASGGWMKNKGK